MFVILINFVFFFIRIYLNAHIERWHFLCIYKKYNNICKNYNNNGWVYKTLRLLYLDQHSVVVITADFESGFPGEIPMGCQFSIPVLLNLCSEAMWA